MEQRVGKKHRAVNVTEDAEEKGVNKELTNINKRVKEGRGGLALPLWCDVDHSHVLMRLGEGPDTRRK